MTAPTPVGHPDALVLDWPIGGGTGWGTFGLNLALELARRGIRPLLFLPPATDLHPLHRHRLRRPIAEQRELAAALTGAGSATIECDEPVLRALGNGFQGHPASARLRGACDVGLIFFEDTRLDPDALARAARFDLIVAGSEWNAAVLRAHGIDRVRAIPQGIDPTIFHPAPRSGAFEDRFVIFSGGKLEYRKGQDLVIAAFRRFRQRHPEALLVTAWHNPWPQTMVGLDAAGHVRGLPEVDARGRLAISAWLHANGLPDGSFVDLGRMANVQLAGALREADVAIFPNRCEGGTNLVAMEAMACGVPCILAANTGQRDLLRPDASYALERQRPVRGGCPLFAGYDGWGESDVEEIVERLEEVWRDRTRARKVGAAAARMMHEAWTWTRQVERLLDALPTPVAAAG